MGAYSLDYLTTNEGRVTICAPADHSTAESRFVFASVDLTIAAALVTLPDTTSSFAYLHIAAPIDALAIYQLAPVLAVTAYDAIKSVLDGPKW